MKAVRGLLICVLLAIFGSAFCVTFCAAQDNSLADLQKKADQASGGNCARLSMQAARQALEDANRLFEGGDVKGADNAIDLSLGYAGRSVDCSLQARKREKDTEIDLRRLIGRVKEVLQTLDTEQRPYLARSLSELQEQRDRMLLALFGAAAGGGTPEAKE